MRELQEALDWSGPNVATQVNDRVRRMALEVLRRYQEGGNRVLGTCRDTDRPFDVDAQLQSLLGRSEALPVCLPELNRYLLDYPKATLGNVESLLCWEIPGASILLRFGQQKKPGQPRSVNAEAVK
jgi:hypothetical protein